MHYLERESEDMKITLDYLKANISPILPAFKQCEIKPIFPKTAFLYVSGCEEDKKENVALEFNHIFDKQEHKQKIYDDMIGKNIKTQIIHLERNKAIVEIVEFNMVDDKFLDFLEKKFWKFDVWCKSNFFKVEYRENKGETIMNKNFFNLCKEVESKILDIINNKCLQNPKIFKEARKHYVHFNMDGSEKFIKIRFCTNDYEKHWLIIKDDEIQIEFSNYGVTKEQSIFLYELAEEIQKYLQNI